MMRRLISEKGGRTRFNLRRMTSDNGVNKQKAVCAANEGGNNQAVKTSCDLLSRQFTGSKARDGFESLSGGGDCGFVVFSTVICVFM